MIATSATSFAAESITLTPLADTSIFQKVPLNNVGGCQSLAVGTTATIDPARALVKFDLADALPGGVTITSVRLEFTVVRTVTSTPATFAAHRLLVDWGEGDKGAGSLIGVGDVASDGEACWAARFQPTSVWASAGGGAGADFVAAASATADLVSESQLIFSSTPELIADVQEWLDHPGNNFGWLLKGQTESAVLSARRFGSRENGDSPPRLILEYELARPRITNAEVEGGQFCLRFMARAGKTYTVERRVKADSGEWTVVSNLPPVTVSEEVVVCEPRGTETRFYRIGER